MAKAEVEPGLKFNSLFLSLVLHFTAVIVTVDESLTLSETLFPRM